MKENTKKYKINRLGSLGVLALGDIGIEAWKKEVEKYEQTKTTNGKNDSKEKK